MLNFKQSKADLDLNDTFHYHNYILNVIFNLLSYPLFYSGKGLQKGKYKNQEMQKEIKK